MGTIHTPTGEAELVAGAGIDISGATISALSPGVLQIPQPVLASLGDKSFRYVVPSGLNAVLTSLGASPFGQVGSNNPAPTNADLRTGSIRINSTSAAANTLIGMHFDPSMPFCRGAAPGVGGFFVAFRFAIAVVQADSIICVGMNNAVIAGGANPSATANRVAFACDTADANLTVLSVDNAGAFTKTAIGAGLAKASLVTGDPNTGGPIVLEASFYALPNTAAIRAKLINRSAQPNVTLFDADVVANLPLNTTNLRPTCVMSTKGATNNQFDFLHFWGVY